ncbi:MAG: hypothetical protein ATN31_10945 [Candidatus Epulonipiscioides saccharophilum]|nr:MAG: hypothetical protein ATN31_10945 [Epulopiscium sp. AS2M-Bin001]
MQEKFEAQKIKEINENELKYGDELRENYGEDIIKQSNAKIKKMDKKEYQRINELLDAININLREGLRIGSASSEGAQKACQYHEELLRLTWPNGSYSKESQLALVSNFVEDERFRDYYEKIAKGCTEFFAKATEIYCKQ